MKEKIKNNRNLINIFVIILVSIFLSIPLFSSRLNIYVDDGIQHIARAYGTKLAFKQNIIFTNIN